MEYLLAALGVLLLVYLTGKFKRWLRTIWYKHNFTQERLVLVLRIRNLEQQIEGLVRELVTWRGYYAPQVELVIIDLDSTDTSQAILERLQAKLGNFYFLSFDCYQLNGLSTMGFKIIELMVIELDSESDYGSNLHKLKKVLNNLSLSSQKIEHQLMS